MLKRLPDLFYNFSSRPLDSDYLLVKNIWRRAQILVEYKSQVTLFTEENVREKLRVPALNLDQDLYVSGKLATGRVMIKDEDVCVHCGLCAERCPTGAWDIQKNNYIEAHNLNKEKVKTKEVA